MTSENYNLESTDQIELEDWAAITAHQLEVFTYIRSPKNPEHSRKIKIIETRYVPLVTILESLHATALVNIISWNKAYAVFPQPTFLQYKAYMLKFATDEYGPLLGDLSSKGWKTQPTIWKEEEDDIRDAWLGRTDCRGAREICRRRIGDSLTWQIPVPTTSTAKSKTPDSVLEYSEFEIERENSRGDELEYTVPCYILKAPTFTSLVLRYEYTSCKESMQAFAFRLETLTRLELLKLEPSERPAALMEEDIFRSYRLHEEPFPIRRKDGHFMMKS